MGREKSDLLANSSRSERQIDAKEPSIDTEFYFQWHITERCNRRCHHCYHVSYESHGELDDQQLFEVADRLEAALDAWDRRGSIGLTGGEPWLRSHAVLALLDRFAEGGRVDRVDLMTNGELLDHAACDELAGRPLLRRVQVSMEGATAACHDAIRGEGSFEETLNAIARMKEHGLTVGVMMTLSRVNQGEIIELLELLRERDVDVFTIDRFIPEGQGEEHQGWLLSRDELKSAFEAVHRWGITHDRPRVLMYRPLFCLIDDTSPYVGAMCSVGANALCFLHDGTIYPCRRLPIALGNVLTDSLHDIWYASPELWKVRVPSNMSGRCSTCKYVPACRGCRAMALATHGDWLGEDPQCWLKTEDTLAS